MYFAYDSYEPMMFLYVAFTIHKSVLLFAFTLRQKSTDNDMDDKNITFEDLPKAMSWMMDKLNKLDSKLDGLNSVPQAQSADQWMNLKELCEYLPSHPAEQTVYGWTSCHQIPYHKRGKRIMFLKSEIDAWLHDGKRKSQKELAEEAAQFIKSKRNRPF